MTKPDELKALDDDELANRLGDARQELFNLRFQVVTGQLDNTARIGQLRRDVARVLTLQRQRELAAFEAVVGGTGTAPVRAAGVVASPSSGNETPLGAEPAGGPTSAAVGVREEGGEG